MIRTIALAVTVAAISTSASTQVGCKGWNCGAEPIPGSQRGSNADGKTNLLDGCVIDAIGRLPKADGLKVTNTSYEYRNKHQELEFWTISISVDLQGRQASYVWLCRVRANSSAELIRMP